MMKFTSPSQELFFSKNDPHDRRLGDVFKFNDGASSNKRQGKASNTNEGGETCPALNVATGLSIIGYPDDDGIQKNGGRVGAAEAPDQIRRWLYRMTLPSATTSARQNAAPASPTKNNSKSVEEKNTFIFEDLGNLSDFKSADLKARHEAVQEKVTRALKAGRKILSFGGGHDYGFPDGAAFLDAVGASQNPLVINFDAHLDVRPTHNGINSGTPFFRLREKSKDFDMIEIGIQKQCNSPAHLDWCAQNGIQVMMLEEFFGNELSLTQAFLNRFKNELHIDRPTFISVDIDAFSWAYAPGCSQSWPTGLEPRDFFPLFNTLLKNLDVKFVSIYEVSPPLDVQFGTAKLGSQIAYKFVEHLIS